MKETLLNTICRSVVDEIKKTATKMYGNVNTKFVDDWFESYNLIVHSGDKIIYPDSEEFDNKFYNGFLRTILCCGPESIVNDIRSNYVARKVAMRLKEFDSLRNVTIDKVIEEIRKSVKPYMLFNAYYGDKKTVDTLSRMVLLKLGVPFYRRMKFSDFANILKSMKHGQVISFTLNLPKNEDVRVYKAFCVELEGNTYYGIHSLDDIGYATMSNGFKNIEVGMVTEIAKFYDEPMYGTYDNENPVMYVLE